MRWYWCFILFILGFLFRILIIQSVPQPFAFDQTQYHDFAQGILRNGLYVHSFRTYGYPLFIAFMYKLTGVAATVSTLPSLLIQAFVDTLTALIVFLIAKKLFQSSIAANSAYVLYLFNPFTAAYTSVLMAEVYTIFWVALIHLLLIHFFQKNNLFTLGILALILGYLPQVRPVFVLYSFAIAVLLFYFCLKIWKSRKTTVIALVLLFLAYASPFTYSIIGNYTYFGEFALLDIDNLFIQNFWVSLFVEKSPEIKLSFWEYPPEVQWVYGVYSAPQQSMAEKKRVQQQFIHYSLLEVQKDPYKFLTWRVKKMWYVWEKHVLYPFHNPKNNLLNTLVYRLNIGFLSFAFFGFVRMVKRRMELDNKLHLFLWLSAFLIVYISFSNAFTTTEERFSLPGYPLICLYAGYGIYSLLEYCTNGMKKLLSSHGKI